MQLVFLRLMLLCCWSSVAVNSASISEGSLSSISTRGLSIENENVNEKMSIEKSFEYNDELRDSKRDKRSGFLSGIGSAILGKVAEASGGLSSGSSAGHAAVGGHNQYENVEYGAPVYGHSDSEKFDIWSFKKAILNTLFQALKAIGGGVIALKGKLIQGGGVLIAAKGKIVSAKGEAVSSLGRNIAASAILAPPKGGYGSGYEIAHVPTGHDSYIGPAPVHSSSGSSGYNHHEHEYAAIGSPPSDSYGHSGYASPSDGVPVYTRQNKIHQDRRHEDDEIKREQDNDQFRNSLKKHGEMALGANWNENNFEFGSSTVKIDNSGISTLSAMSKEKLENNDDSDKDNIFKEQTYDYKTLFENLNHQEPAAINNNNNNNNRNLVRYKETKLPDFFINNNWHAVDDNENNNDEKKVNINAENYLLKQINSSPGRINHYRHHRLISNGNYDSFGGNGELLFSMKQQSAPAEMPNYYAITNQNRRNFYYF